MNVYLSFLQSNNKYNITGYSFWEYYIKNGLIENNDTWIESSGIDWVFPLSTNNNDLIDKWKSEVWSKVLIDVKQHMPDMFLSYLYPSMIDINAINEIKKLGIPCVNFFCDNVRLFQKIPDIFKVFDLNWVPEFQALKMYDKSEIAKIFLPMPMWIPQKYRGHAIKETNKISFIGTNDKSRTMLFNSFFNKYPEMNISIYGNGWLNNIDYGIAQNNKNSDNIILNQIDFVKKYGIKAFFRKLFRNNINISLTDQTRSKCYHQVSQNDYFDILKQSKVTLGINRFDSLLYSEKKPNKFSRLRDIEAPMLGACYLTEYVEGLERYYDLGTEIFVYENVDELYNMIQELDSNEILRLNLRINAQKKALNELSIPSSINKLKLSLNIK